MLRNLSELFFASILLIYVVPYFIWKFAKTDKYAPLPIIQIVSGILLGPAILGHFYPTFYNYLFTKDNINVLSGVAWLGIVFFVWTAGLHLNLKSVAEKKKDTFTTALFGLTFPLIFGSVFAYFIHSDSTWIGPNAQPWQFVLGIGMAVAVTALPILVLIMEKLNIFHLPIGKRVLTYASLDDIMIWTVLAIIIMDWDRSLRQVIFLPIFFVASYILSLVIEKLRNKDDIWYISLIWVVAVSLSADWSGLHYIVGGFMAGVVMKKEWFDEEQIESFKRIVLLLMMPIYFLLTGLRTGWELSGLGVLSMAVALFIIQFIGKSTGVFIAGSILKWPKKEWILIGSLLQTKALIEIIFCTILLDKGIITSNMFTALLIMAVLSTVVTTPIGNKLLKKKVNDT